MPRDPHEPQRPPLTEEEYRRRMAAKAKRRKKRQMQRILLICAFVVAAALLIFCIIAVFRAIFGGDKEKTKSGSSSSASVAEPASLPTEGPGLSWTVAPNPDVWNLILVNNQHALPEDFNLATEDLATITYEGVSYYFDARIAEDLNRLLTDCNAVEGHSLRVISGYRSAERQNQNYDYMVQQYVGQGQSAEQADILARQVEPPAGHSEHQTGLALDFVTGSVAQPGAAFADTKEFAWLVEHAHEYGFILRYPSEKEAITGIKVQPYHWRYVGVDDAAVMKAEGTSLEEYVAKLPDDSSEEDEPESREESTPTSEEGGDASDAGGDVMG